MARTSPALPLCPGQAREGKETKPRNRFFTTFGTPGKRPGPYQPGPLTSRATWVWSRKEYGRRWSWKEKGDGTSWWGRVARGWDGETFLEVWGAIPLKSEIEAEWAAGWRTRATTKSPVSGWSCTEAKTVAQFGQEIGETGATHAIVYCFMMSQAFCFFLFVVF